MHLTPRRIALTITALASLTALGLGLGGLMGSNSEPQAGTVSTDRPGSAGNGVAAVLSPARSATSGPASVGTGTTADPTADPTTAPTPEMTGETPPAMPPGTPGTPGTPSTPDTYDTYQPTTNAPEGSPGATPLPTLPMRDTTGPRISIVNTTCGSGTATVVFTATDPAGVASVTADYYGTNGATKYIGMAIVVTPSGTNRYTATVPTTNRTTNQLVIEAHDARGNSSEYRHSNFCL